MSELSFKLSDSFVEGYRRKKPPFGFNGLGELTYMRTYSRVKEDGHNEKWYETVRRVVEGCYSMQKDHIKKYGLGWSKYKADRSAEEMYDRMYNMKFLPPGRGLWAMGTSLTTERGLFAALNNCFSGDTEILTKDGVKKLADVVDTTQEVLTHKGNWIKAPIRSFGVQKTVNLNLRRGKRTKTIQVTPDHNWAFKKVGDLSFVKTKDLKLGTLLNSQFQVKSPSIKPSAFGISQGIVYGDGTKGHLYLCGKKDEQLKKWFPLSPITEDENKCEGGALRVADLPRSWKDLPSIDESKSFLLGWLMGYVAADGHCSQGQIGLDSNDKMSVEFAMLVATKLGIRHYGITGINNSSSFKENYVTYRLSFYRGDLSEDFLLIDKHRDSFVSAGVIKSDYKRWKVESIEKGPSVEVFCATVDGYGTFTLTDNILTGNCAFVSTDRLGESNDESTKPFEFLMDMSMLGVGVGFDVKGEGRIILKNPKDVDDTYVIDDTREGWVESVKVVLLAYFAGHALPEFNYSEIRKKDAPIKTFGGKASGPAPLKELHEAISSILKDRESERITITDIADIMNMIGACVVAGNVRRTAEIMFGDPANEEYLKLKDYRWDGDKHENVGSNVRRADFGWTSNNSVFAEVGMDYTKVGDQTGVNGEPGYAWLGNMQKYGRMVDPINNKDRRAKGGNPCLEQTLESYELCCLVETFPIMHDSLEDYKRTLKFAYLYAKSVTLGNTHWEETNRVMLRNRRIGTSQSGIAMFIEKYGLEEYRVWCDEGYKSIQSHDEDYSDWLCIPRSVKTTSIKPSGTVSLLPGVTPGMHYPESNHYIRRIRIANSSPLVQRCVDSGYDVEADVVSRDTSVVSIPVEISGVRTVDQVSPWEQVALASFIQKWWADNQVSCTVTFSPKDADQIKNMLNYSQYSLKGISFLPKVELGAYQQMPYEEITEKEYKEMSLGLTRIDFSKLSEDSVPEKFCDGKTCEI